MSSSSISVSAMILGVTLAAAPLSAAAQPQAPTVPPSDTTFSEARSLYVAGAELADAERWADAAEHFTRSYELSGAPPALFNLGFALRALGRHRAACEVMEALVERHGDAIDGEMRRSAERFAREARERVAQLSLEIPSSSPCTIATGGRTIVDDGARPVLIETDAGPVAVEVRCEGYERFDWAGELAEGQRRSVTVLLSPVVDLRVPLGPDGPPPPTTVDEPSIVTKWWFWTAIVVVVGAALAATIAVTTQEEPLSSLSQRHYSL